MEEVITSYIADGFMVVNKTVTSTTLQKKKEFNIVWAILGFILSVIPLLVYLIIYAMQPDSEVVQIVIIRGDAATL